MDDKKDIGNFDALESGKTKNEHLLQSIASLDSIMNGQNIEPVSSDFTQKLIKDILSAESKTFKNKAFKLMAFIFLPITVISVFVIYLSSGTFESPALISQTMEEFSLLLQFATDPKVQQLFLIGEGIILLVIVEKIASSYRMFKHPSHQ